MRADDCTNYLSCAPTPSTFVPTLPPDIAPKVAHLADTGSVAPLLVVAITVGVLLVAAVLIWIGRRSK